MRNMLEEEDFENECLKNDGRLGTEKARIIKQMVYKYKGYTVCDYLYHLPGGFKENSHITDFWSNYIYHRELPVHHFYQYDDREKTPEMLEKELRNHIRVNNIINSRY